MHILDCYSLNSGLKVRKPFIFDKYFPLDIYSYITFDPYSNFPSRKYDYWSDVINALFPILESKGIGILLIGNGKDTYEKTYDLRNQASTNQISYILQNSLLHLSVDGFSNHLAAHKNKKIVSLFSDSSPQNSAPFFGDANNHRFLLSESKTGNFSYSPEEKPKSINSIKPEDIINSVCELLGIEHTHEYQTLKIGNDYIANSLECVPDGNPIDVSSINVDSLIMRMDLNHDEMSLAKQCQVGKCSVITENPISINIVNHLKPSLVQFVYLLGEKDSKQYVEDLYSIGVQCLLMTEKTGDELEALKFKYLDYGQIHQRRQGQKPKELEGEDLNNVYYRSNKYLIHNSQIYYTTSSFEKSMPTDMLGSSKFQKVIDEESFWKESENLYFVKKI